MDILLIIVTFVSLAFAMVLLVLNWRLIREKRLRSAARVEALLEAVSALPAASAFRQAQGVLSLPKDAEGFRRRDASADRRRLGRRLVPSPAQRADAVPPSGALVAEEPAADATPQITVDHAKPAVMSSHELFHEAADAASGFGRLVVPMSLGVVIISAVLAGLLMWSHGRAKASPVASAAVAADHSVAVPLELMSLRHERTTNGLSITGLVRNPASGHRVSDLNVVVFLFDRNGAFVTSARGPLDFRTLAPGDESPFTISLDKIGSVGRYRVSFRADDTVVPHVDRRQDSGAVAAGFGAPGRSDTRSPVDVAAGVASADRPSLRRRLVGGPTKLEERSRVVTVASMQPY